MALGAIIAGLVAYNLNKLHDELISVGVDKWEELETKFNNNFSNYYESAYRSCSIVPFSLSPNKEIKLIDVYQTSNLEYNENPQGHISITTDSVENILNISKHAWIYGHGGIGKSTMLKYFFLRALSDSENKVDYRIPVYIELRRYNQEELRGKSFFEFLYNVMKNSNFDLEYKYFEFMIQKGRFIFLLDAFDEVVSQHQEAVAYGISDLMTKYHENSVLVTSRKLTERYVNAQNDMISLETNGLNKEQAISLVQKVSKMKIGISKEVIDSFLVHLEEELYVEYESFASNPILLLLMLQTFQANQDFPKQESAFLLESFDYLYNKHDSSKNVALKREFKTKQTKSILRKILSHFCFRLYYKEENSYELSQEKLEKILEDVLKHENCVGVSVTDLIDDFMVCLSLLHREGGYYYFVHNIFKEFFAAYYLYEQTSQNQQKFFKGLLSAPDTNWRLVNTTLKYFDELDKDKGDNKARFNLLLPILTDLEASEDFIGYEYLFPTHLGVYFDTEDLTPELMVATNYDEGNIVESILYYGEKSPVLTSVDKKLDTWNIKEISLFVLDYNGKYDKLIEVLEASNTFSQFLDNMKLFELPNLAIRMEIKLSDYYSNELFMKNWLDCFDEQYQFLNTLSSQIKVEKEKQEEKDLLFDF